MTPAPADVVRALWECMEARDWEAARATLADSYTCDYPETGERFPSADAFIAMNHAFPEGWSITVDEVLAQGSRVAARIRVSFAPVDERGAAVDGELFHCLSFADVEDGLIARSTDFWLTDHRDPPPDWRAPFWVPQTEEDDL